MLRSGEGILAQDGKCSRGKPAGEFAPVAASLGDKLDYIPSRRDVVRRSLEDQVGRVVRQRENSVKLQGQDKPLGLGRDRSHSHGPGDIEVRPYAAWYGDLGGTGNVVALSTCSFANSTWVF